MKTQVTTEISWQEAVRVVLAMAEKIDSNGSEFALWDAERLEAAARLVRRAISEHQQNHF